MSEQNRASGLPEPPKPPNRFLAAIKDDVNKVGLAAIAAAWAASGMLAVPFVGLAAEAAYLLFAPESSWFRKRLHARQQAAEGFYRARLQEAVLPRAESQTRRGYEAMLRARETIGESMDPKEATSREMLRQLDYMLEKYLLFTHQIVQYHRYLAHLHGDRSGRDLAVSELATRLTQLCDDQLERLNNQLRRANDDRTRSVVQQNIDVLQKKRALIERVATMAQNLTLHLQLFRNSFDLVGGLVQTRPPDEVLQVINDAVGKAELTSALNEQSSQIQEEIRQLRLEVL
ncbi:MAG: hypothetical protein HY321_07660 [Armatimonadetes bacterium]|nr:hypothetical protein [Armatimonadota bacterium]